MKLLFALMLAAGASAGPDANAPESSGLPTAAQTEIERVERGMAFSEEGRRLLAQTRRVRRRAAKLSGDPVAYRHGADPYLAFDVEDMERLTETEFQLLLARELARASLALPPEIVEVEFFARQRQLLFALELAASDREFSKRLRELARIPPGEPEPAPRRGETGAVGRGLALAAKDPAEYYDWVEGFTAGERPRFALAELEDYEKLHAFDAERGRRRRRELAATLARLRPTGGLARAKEALDGFDVNGAAELARRARKWLNSSR